MALNIFNPGVNTSFTSELNSNFNNGYRVPLLNVVSQLEDRSVVVSADGGLFAEAYVDADGRLGSVTRDSQVTDSPYPDETKSFTFKSDGTVLYISGRTGLYSRYVDQYPLSTAWDLDSKGSRTGHVQISSYGAADISFNSDGTKLYILQSLLGYDKLISYSLSTAWDISSTWTEITHWDMTNSGNHTFFSRSIIFSSDGLNLYITTDSGVKHYNLSIAWDVSSKALQSITTLGNSYDLVIKNSTTIFSISDDIITEYSLSIAWDLSTATTTSTQKISPIVSNTNRAKLYIKSDGTMLFTSTDEVIYKLVFETNWSLTDFKPGPNQYIEFDTDSYKNNDTSNSSLLYHTIPTGTFSPTISSAFCTYFVENWEEGNSVEFRLFSNSTDDSGWLSTNQIVSFTEFSSEPTILLIRLNLASTPTDGYPSIKGVAMIGDY